ncbi:hypothetical protein [Variovorax gossypii]
MPGDLRMDESPVHCPVHRVAITPCEVRELAPLLDYLSADSAVQGSRSFPRGTMLDDGRLDLCKQSLGTDNCLQLVAALRHNTRVRSLMLGTDAIGDAGAGAVARLAAANAHLEVLYLGCNNIGPEGAGELAAAVAQAPQVTCLWLKRNPLGPEGAQSIARMLRGNRNLRVLDLVNTDLRGAGVRAVVDALCAGGSGLRSLYLREPLKTAVFSPSLTQAVRNPQICLFFVQFRLFLGFFVPHSSRIGPLQAHLGL